MIKKSEPDAHNSRTVAYILATKAVEPYIQHFFSAMLLLDVSAPKKLKNNADHWNNQGKDTEISSYIVAR